jgi:hypothetical protein
MRQLNGPGRPLEQFHAQLFFERFNLRAEWRLGDVQFLGSTAEAKFLRYRDKVSEVSQFHILLILDSYQWRCKHVLAPSGQLWHSW